MPRVDKETDPVATKSLDVSGVVIDVENYTSVFREFSGPQGDVAVITPASGKKIKIRHTRLIQQPSSLDMKLVIKVGGVDVVIDRSFKDSVGAQQTINVTGDRDAPLRLVTIGAAQSDKMWLGVNYFEI